MSKSHHKITAAVIGSGPAGLMAATVLSEAGIPTTVYEKKPHAARKLLVAGRTGLNVSNDLPEETWLAALRGPQVAMKRVLKTLSREDWLAFLQKLGIKTFRGPTGRYFVDGLVASPLVRAWTKKLKESGVTFQYRKEVTDFAESPAGGIILHFADGTSVTTAAVCFALGGASWERTAVRWPKIFQSHGVALREFTASNAGFTVAWPKLLVKEAQGLPLKNIVFTTASGTRAGELIITRYGLEGTPIYDVGVSGAARLDLKADLTLEQIRQKLNSVKENLSPIRRAKKVLNLSPAALALLFHLTPAPVRNNLDAFAKILKAFPILLGERQGLARAISSNGGIKFSELDKNLMLKKHPGVFVAGEMLDWDAPTGGYLIHTCAAQGLQAGRGMVENASHERRSSESTPI